MSQLRAVLARYGASGPHFGDMVADSAAPAHTTNDDLSRDLQAVSSRNQIFFLICISMIVLVFIGACAITVKYLSDPSAVTKIFAASGISITGLLIQTLKFWKDKVNSDTVLVLARNLSPQDTRAIIEILLRS